MQALTPFVLSFLVLIQGCLIVDGSVHRKQIQSVALLPADNSGLRREYRAQPNGGIVQLLVPNYIDANALVPRIEFDGGLITVDGRPWRPGDPLDLTKDHQLEVLGFDREARGYELHVSSVPPATEKRLVSVQYGPWWLTGGFMDSRTIVSDETLIEFAVSGDSDPTMIRLGFNYQGLSLDWDGIPTGGPIEQANLEDSHTITVHAEDLSTAVYTLKGQRESMVNGRVRFNNDERYFSSSTEGTITLSMTAGTDLTAAKIIFSVPVRVSGEDWAANTTHSIDLTTPLVVDAPRPWLTRRFTILAIVP